MGLIAVGTLVASGMFGGTIAESGCHKHAVKHVYGTWSGIITLTALNQSCTVPAPAAPAVRPLRGGGSKEGEELWGEAWAQLGCVSIGGFHLNGMLKPLPTK